MPFQNDRALGNILIIAEDLEDVDVMGARLHFDFSALGTVTIKEITVIDVEPQEADGMVALSGPDGNIMLAGFDLIITGGNGQATVGLGPTAGVAFMDVILNGSGGDGEVVFMPDDICGNGAREGGETCDGADDQACPALCRSAGSPDQCMCPADCGNGVIEDDEECDDANDVDKDDCRNDCTLPECGDGIIDRDEECDDDDSVCRDDDGDSDSDSDSDSDTDGDSSMDEGDSDTDGDSGMDEGDSDSVSGVDYVSYSGYDETDSDSTSMDEGDSDSGMDKDGSHELGERLDKRPWWWF